MKWMILLTVLIMVFAAGCAAEQPAAEALDDAAPAPEPEPEKVSVKETIEDARKAAEEPAEEPAEDDGAAEEAADDEASAEEPAEEEPAAEEETGPSLQETDEELYNLMEEAKSKNYDNFHYTYRGPEYPQEAVEFYIKGTKGKALPSKPTRYKEDEKYETVYLDFTTASAKGFCESPECELRYEEVYVDFNDFNIPTPVDRLAKISEGIERVGGAQIDSRKVIKIKYVSDTGEAMQAYVDEFYGIPLKIEKVDSDGIATQTIEYRSLSIGGVKDADVTAPN